MAAKARLGLALAAVLAVLAALPLAGRALAHAAYARSAPGAGAVVAAAPAQVDIWFTQDLFRRQGENSITVTGPAGASAHAGDAAIDDDDRRHMTVALQGDLPPGEYLVAWRSLSAEDGDDEEGTFTFTLDPQAPVTSTPMSAATPPSQPSPTPAPALPSPTPAASSSVGCGFGLAPVAGLLVLGLGARRRRSPR
jgi:hypothetical protein